MQSQRPAKHQSQPHRRAEGKAVLIDIVGDGVSGSQKAGESQRRRADKKNQGGLFSVKYLQLS